MNFQSAPNTLTSIFISSFQIFEKKTFQMFYRHKKESYISYAEFSFRVRQLCLHLIQMGLETGETVLLLCHNHPQWLLAEISSLMVGGVTVPLNPDLPPSIIKKIIKHSKARIAFLENSAIWQENREFQKIQENLSQCIFFDKYNSAKKNHFNLDELSDKKSNIDNEEELNWFSLKKYAPIVKRISQINARSAASLLYTNFFQQKRDFRLQFDKNDSEAFPYEPLAVTLSHGNIYSNLYALSQIIPMDFQDKLISFLPTWNPMQRVAAFLSIYRGAALIHTKMSSLPKDMRRFQPTYLITLPHFLEIVHKKFTRRIANYSFLRRGLFNGAFFIARKLSKTKKFFTGEETHFHQLNTRKIFLSGFAKIIRAILLLPFEPLLRRYFRIFHQFFGGKCKYIITGGRTLKPFLDTFYDSLGLQLLEGYGLPEAGPVVSIRRPPSKNFRPRRILYTAGPLLENTDVKLIDPETQEDVSQIPGAKGIIYIRGPQVMKEYYADKKKTKEIIDQEKWLKTGDLGRFTVNYELQILERRKKEEDY
jgi:long-chain acyl-CoA synthetase